MLLIFTASAAVAEPPPPALEAWEQYVATTEARMETQLSSSRGFLLTDFSTERATTRQAIFRGDVPVGKVTTANGSHANIQIPGATIAHWRGAIFLPGITLDELLHRLQHPEDQGPLPPDVLALRVRNRRPDELTLAMRLRRQAIVTVTYDTEHAVRYRRLTANRASSKSISTSIREIADAGTSKERVVPAGQDRGFLWRMNAYWRYEGVAGGVILELESLTLSRSIPLGLGRFVEPIIDRIARESMTRTLTSMRQLYAAAIQRTSP